ncbi:MAG: DUF167 domain-containing protein [Ignavibacteriae bacterium]|nr:DUF167 domain-containing protein [Ignavibacteriota bacterium]
MKISIHIKPNARKNEVKHLDDNRYLVSVIAPPVQGKANEKLIEVLAEYFGKPKRKFSIVRGATSREKIVEVVE